MKVNNENEVVTINARVPFNFAECVKKYHKEFNVKLNFVSDYKNEWQKVNITGQYKNIVLLNSKCEKETYDN